jgi:hypothetical protein
MDSNLSTRCSKCSMNCCYFLSNTSCFDKSVFEILGIVSAI